MARIHVIYDPNDRLQTSHTNMPPEIKVAILPIAEHASNLEIEQTIQALARLLANQIWHNK